MRVAKLLNEHYSPIRWPLGVSEAEPHIHEALQKIVVEFVCRFACQPEVQSLFGRERLDRTIGSRSKSLRQTIAPRQPTASSSFLPIRRQICGSMRCNHLAALAWRQIRGRWSQRATVISTRSAQP